jgi:hypothetical protein
VPPKPTLRTFRSESSRLSMGSACSHHPLAAVGPPKRSHRLILVAPQARIDSRMATGKIRECLRHFSYLHSPKWWQ